MMSARGKIMVEVAIDISSAGIDEDTRDGLEVPSMADDPCR
jgi:hypothetical protein